MCRLAKTPTGTKAEPETKPDTEQRQRQSDRARGMEAYTTTPRDTEAETAAEVNADILRGSEAKTDRLHHNHVDTSLSMRESLCQIIFI